MGHVYNPEFYQGIMEAAPEREYDPKFRQGVLVTIPGDYRKLQNKPTINSVTVDGDLSLNDFNLYPIFCATTASWNSDPSLDSIEGAIYIYSDYATKVVHDETINIPALKIGDGFTKVVDLSFIRATEFDVYEIANSLYALDALVTPHDRLKWNNKVETSIDPIDPENLGFSAI